MTQKEKLVIIGSGPAGLTSAVYAGRAHLSPLVIDGHEPGGQLMTTTLVENWPGEISIKGPDLMKKLREHAAHYKAKFLHDIILSVDLSRRPFVLTTQRLSLETDALIIATGAQPKKLGCPGESAYWSKGVTTCAVCDGAFYRDMPVIVVGGGDTAMESASFLTHFTKDITLIHRKPELSASRIMQERVLNNPSIKIMYDSTLASIEGDGRRVTQVQVLNGKTGETVSLKAQGVFLAIGLTPTTALFKEQLELNSYGYIALKEHTNTSIPGVFAAGDVADSRYRQAITAAGTGCAAFLDAERYLKDEKLL